MMRASHKQPGFGAALLHRLSGIALAIFLPLHFLALATALNGADALDSFLALGYLGWFAGPSVLMATTAAVIMVMWRRQFASESRRAVVDE